jgi:hypothetical protein
VVADPAVDVDRADGGHQPCARISATTWAICAASRCANSLWSMAMSVRRPALSCASVAPGTSRQHRLGAGLQAQVVGGAFAGGLPRNHGAGRPPWRRSITAPFSATMAATGQASANGSLQPPGGR